MARRAARNPCAVAAAAGNLTGSRATLAVLAFMIAVLAAGVGKFAVLPALSFVLVLKLHEVERPRRLKAVWHNAIERYDRGHCDTYDDNAQLLLDAPGAQPEVSS